jgi:taurine dioxygenase
VALRDASEAVMERVLEAFAAHSVLAFPDQNLSLDEQLAVTARFGKVLRVPYIQGIASHPDAIAVLKEADEKRISTFGGSWHTDFSFLPEPPDATLLQAVDLPSVGGDTVWANQYLAYESLSSGMRRLLDPLRAVHTGWPHGTRGPGPEVPVSRSIKMTRNDPGADAEQLHPVVRRHPVTGRPALFVNPVYVQRFEDMTAEESKPLLDYLNHHCTRPELQIRLRWRPGMLLLWDNRSTMHLAINDYDGQRRLLHRTTVAGARPVGVTEAAV